MSDKYRVERIERLLDELKYEISRGMMEGEVCETLTFRFYVPISKVIPDGVVACHFETRPVPRYAMIPSEITPRLRLVKP